MCKFIFSNYIKVIFHKLENNHCELCLYSKTILCILVSIIDFIPTGLSTHNFVIAQSGNNLGQESDGSNDASQSPSTSQSTNQDSLCVSGETTSWSCNNLSSKSIGESNPGEEGPAGPQGEPGSSGTTWCGGRKGTHRTARRKGRKR